MLRYVYVLSTWERNLLPMGHMQSNQQNNYQNIRKRIYFLVRKLCHALYIINGSFDRSNSERLQIQYRKHFEFYHLYQALRHPYYPDVTRASWNFKHLGTWLVVQHLKATKKVSKHRITGTLCMRSIVDHFAFYCWKIIKNTTTI